MELLLPKKTGCAEQVVLGDARQVTVIGANGSGKTRFCNQIMALCPGKAFRLCAMRALFPETRTEVMPGSIADIFNRINDANPMLKSMANTEFDKLVHIMLTEEFYDLMRYKTHLLLNEEQPVPKTKLDVTVKMWQEVFPKNKVLRENGKLVFSNDASPDRYSSLRLSDGEKAVLYYIGAVQYAMPGAVILVDDPESFIHSSIMTTLWNVIEEIRPDCTFVYNTHNLEFASSRIDNRCIWVKSFDPAAQEWDYEVMTSSSHLSEGIYLDILGSRKPVLFIEGDDTHSIDGKLYPLIFREYTVKPLGSCNKVIECVRTFNDLQSFHHLNSWGIVDRDRRSEKEVEYLRAKKILVPDVAEVENILLLEGVIKAVARHRKKNPDEVFARVKRAVMRLFEAQLRQQALQHVRHRVKRDVEMRIDKRFTNISALEEHMVDLVKEIDPRASYEALCRQFHGFIKSGDYAQVLRVFNQKNMLPDCGVAALLGLADKKAYIHAVLSILKSGAPEAESIRSAIKACFNL
ncbi:MAG: DUF4435 domain-containing protein [Bacteroidales bacterium]|nr:DUF4435 domain-containing protein [Bacteroidales bacterium]